jgi:uncharacterized membrane protein
MPDRLRPDSSLFILGTMPETPKRTRRLPLVGEQQSIEALTHGIFAITMTLLILELRVPDTSQGHLGEALTDLAPNIAAYLFGFVYLMAVWISLRAFFRDLTGITKSVTVLLLVTVGAVSLTPFTVSTMAAAIGNSDDLGVAVRMMAAVVGFSYLVSTFAAKLALSQGTVPPNSWYAMPWWRATALSTSPAILGFGLSYVDPWLGLGVLALDIVLGILNETGPGGPAPVSDAPAA